MATIDFLAGENFTIASLSGSGLGFYGSAFGASVLVGEYQQTTFITNSNGTTQGPQVDNVKWLNSASGIVGSATSGIALTAIPNYLATLNIRFTHSSPVLVQNAVVRGYDRVSIDNAPTGVTLKGAYFVHPNNTQNNDGSGSTTWTTLAGSSTYLSLPASPGLSGLSPNGPSTSSVQHDYYIGLSASPNSVGSKSLGLYVSLEYL